MTTAKPKNNFKLLPCKVCKENVAWNAKTCPHCGVKKPTTTLKDQLIGTAVVFALLAILSQCGGEPNENAKEDKTEQTKTTSYETVASEEIASTAPSAPQETQSTPEELREALNLARQRGDLVNGLWLHTEGYVSNATGIVINEDLIKAKNLFRDIATTLIMEKNIVSDEQTESVFKNLNNELLEAALAAEDRIEKAIDLAKSSKNPNKTAQKFISAKQRYETNILQFNENYEAARQRLLIVAPPQDLSSQEIAPSFVSPMNFSEIANMDIETFKQKFPTHIIKLDKFEPEWSGSISEFNGTGALSTNFYNNILVEAYAFFQDNQLANEATTFKAFGFDINDFNEIERYGLYSKWQSKNTEQNVQEVKFIYSDETHSAVKSLSVRYTGYPLK